ncbi:hypothetical protein N5D61_17030 [Pseudomonas sp. GD03842]|uniref:hypothetical protein n=1 Tax=Pseudomonas sp. GD03842 TaxID=2975385 RepID=UPI002447B094|nr:hypothetical protein [Pseudomonas sp. GD03842]MDH0748034.1 hypothetical protein [Pseudomonas sp. GD03842]
MNTQKLILGLAFSVLATGAFALPTVHGTSAVAENGSSHTHIERVAADGADRVGANRVAENGSDRTALGRIAADGADRVGANRLS